MMIIPESQWEWWDEQTAPKNEARTICQRCGVYASKTGGLTRHHQKNGESRNSRTGKITKLCRKCHTIIHNMEPKYMSHTSYERAFNHIASCEACADKMLLVIDHSFDRNNDCP